MKFQKRESKPSVAVLLAICLSGFLFLPGARADPAEFEKVENEYQAAYKVGPLANYIAAMAELDGNGLERASSKNRITPQYR